MRKMFESIRKYRGIPTVILASAGIALMVYYDYCGTSCSYLKGDIGGVDLKWIGMAYMAVIVVFTLFRRTSFVRLMLAGGLGVEVYLYAFQIRHDVYCPLCLAFSVMVILLFAVNYELPSAWRENRGRMWFYFLGEANFPLFRIRRLPLIIVGILGYLFVLFFFSGSVTPAYGGDDIPDIKAECAPAGFVKTVNVAPKSPDESKLRQAPFKNISWGIDNPRFCEQAS